MEPFHFRQGAAKNLIFDVPHLGRSVPLLAQKHERLIGAARKRWDHQIDKVYEYLFEQMGGTWLCSTMSRLVVDLNRGADRVDIRTSPRWPGARKYEDGGVIVPAARIEGTWNPLYPSGLEPEEIELRLKEFWYPYHERLQQTIDSITAGYGHALLISLHSAKPPDDETYPHQPVVYLGTGDGTTCPEDIILKLRINLSKNNIMVITKGTYQGAFTTQAYGREQNVHAIQIELDRRYLMKNNDLENQLQPLVEALSTISQSRIPTSTSRSRNKIAMQRTYLDPLTGDIYPY